MQCDHFDAGRCRSCTFMGVPYAAQLASRQERCHAALAGVATSLVWDEAWRSAEAGFRNKAKLVVGGRPGAVTLGILDAGGRGIDLQSCGLYEPGLAAALPAVADVVDGLGIEPYDVAARRGQLKHVIVTHSPAGELMVRFVLRTRHEVRRLEKALPALRASLPHVAVVSVNLQPEHKAILEGDTEIILTDRQILPMQVNDVVLELRPNSFFQTNTSVAAALYRQAAGWVDGLSPRTLWDLYCGVGGFALHCAGAPGSGRQVLGIEVSPDAVASGRHSADRLDPEVRARVDFLVGDATTVGSSGRDAPDVVVVNPPRRGIGAQLAAWLDGSTATHVVYSSCNVDSLARDLAAMPAFTARSARLFDMFPQTGHHEVMVLLERSRRSRGRLS